MRQWQIAIGMFFLSLLCIGLARGVSSSSNSVSLGFQNRQILVEDSMIYSSYFGGDSHYSRDDRAAHTCVGPDGCIYVLIYSDTESWATVNAYHDTYQGGDSDIVLLKLSSDGSDLLYCTYLGGNGLDYPFHMVVDDSDNVYITGMTDSTNLATAGVYDETQNGEDDIFVMKFNPTDNELIYATYIGGCADDNVYCIGIDSAGDVYLTGTTWSSDFPVQDGIDETFNGTEDVFILKLGPNGEELLFSSFLGGDLAECGTDLVIGQEGSIYLTGWTSSPNFYTTHDAFDRTLNGSSDGFLMNVASDGSEILFSTFLGGESTDQGSYCVVDSDGYCYVTGWTRSNDFPIVGGWQDSRNGSVDCYLLKMNEYGSEILYSSYLGGFDDDYPRGMALDGWGCVYLVGGTNSDDFPLANAFDTELDGEQDPIFSIDCFISKLDPTSNKLLYSSYLGGSHNDDPEGIALDANCNIIICGMSDAEDYPVTLNSHQDEFWGGEMDAFLTILYDWGDMDCDGLAECQEISERTDRANNDTDFDLLPDGYEVAHGLDPKNPEDALWDHDADGPTTYHEYTIGTDPRSQDSDNDSYSDGWEVVNGYDPRDGNVPLHEILHYNAPIILLAAFSVVVLSLVYKFRDRLRQNQPGLTHIDKDETKKAFAELTGKLPPAELVTQESLTPSRPSIEVDLEHFRSLEGKVSQLEELEEVLESRIKPTLMEKGADPSEIEKINIGFLVKDRDSIDSVELEVLTELERIIDLPPPKEMLRLLEARRRLEIELEELGGLNKE